ncbi:MAG TPA: hypothetical protein VHO70_15045 [Chitinispirillaceae bacterium]|nr:hypothetical protein [Chitinispirillaceae bacterium]
MGNAIPGIPFPLAAPVGNVYGGHDHTGTHCAHGLTEATKKAASYQTDEAYKESDCITFGGADMFDSTETFFCKDCCDYIKAEDLSDIRKNWSK